MRGERGERKRKREKEKERERDRGKKLSERIGNPLCFMNTFSLVCGKSSHLPFLLSQFDAYEAKGSLVLLLNDVCTKKRRTESIRNEREERRRGIIEEKNEKRIFEEKQKQ